MKYNQVGNSALHISEISFGCMSLGLNHNENSRLLQKAVEKGINFFDTADLYQKGDNEVTVGKAFKGLRDKVIIASKVGNQWRNDGSGWDWNPSKKYILKAVEESLQRLQTDYIDLYQLHGGTIDDPFDETIEAFELLQEQGKIRYYGISSIRPNVIREYVHRSNIISVMMQYSLLDRRPEEFCLDYLLKHNIGVLARGSLATGLLINKDADRYLSHSHEAVEKAAQVVKDLAHNASRMAVEVAARFVLQNPAITSIALGIRTQEQLNDAKYISDSLPLEALDMETLKESVEAKIYEQHR